MQLLTGQASNKCLAKFNFFTQVLVGTPGNEPEECARDYITIIILVECTGMMPPMNWCWRPV